MLRSLLACCTGLIAAVLLPLSILSVWVHEVVSDTDTYVETVTPLADDDAVQAAATDELQRETLQLVAATGRPLPPGGEQLVRLVVQRIVASPAFRTAWAQANRAAHRQLVAVLEDRHDQVTLDADGRVVIELDSVLDDIVQSLAAQGLLDPEAVSGLDASFEVMDADQLTQARRLYQLLDTLGFWVPVAWALAVLLTLALARRRLAATSRLAWATLPVVGLLALALVFARDVVTGDLAQRDVARAVWDVVVRSLWHEIAAAAVALVVVAVVTGLLSWLTTRGSVPSGPPPDGLTPHSYSNA